MNIAFVLVSYGIDEPAGMEKSLAALTRGLKELGQNVFIIAAGPSRASDESYILRLDSLQLEFPLTDNELLYAVDKNTQLNNELKKIGRCYKFDVVCWVDALWGLGILGLPIARKSNVLMMHVKGDRYQIERALSHCPDLLLFPSSYLREDMKFKSFPSKVLPNALLYAPDSSNQITRKSLRQIGPIRSICRLGEEKGALIAVSNFNLSRRFEIALASASFETKKNSQGELFRMCQAFSSDQNVKILPQIPWNKVLSFLKSGAITIIPSTAESFGLVALESMSVGTPVIAFEVGNLRDLVGEAGRLVPIEQGGLGLWLACQSLLNDKEEYLTASEKAIERSACYDRSKIAKLFLRMV